MDFVNVEHRDDVCVIRLNRPPVNAMNAALRTELASALEAAQNDAVVKGIVLACDARIVTTAALLGLPKSRSACYRARAGRSVCRALSIRRGLSKIGGHHGQ